MRTSLQVHASEETLEDYAFGRLDETRLASFEEHLLICGECQAALTQTDHYIRLMKTATAELQAEAADQPAKVLKPKIAPRRWQTWTGWGLAGACACLAGLVYLRPAPVAMAVPVVLVSTRGADVAAHAPAQRALDLQCAQPLAAGPYRLELVTSGGRMVWSGEASLQDGKLTARASGGFPQGLYWVRAYDASGLFREFGLQLE